MKKLHTYGLLVLILMFSCKGNQDTDHRLEALQKSFDGKWSIYQEDGCLTLSVENSQRISESPDSLMFFIDEIDYQTKDIDANCVNLDIQVTGGGGVVSSKSSKVYRVRP